MNCYEQETLDITAEQFHAAISLLGASRKQFAFWAEISDEALKNLVQRGSRGVRSDILTKAMTVMSSKGIRFITYDNGVGVILVKRASCQSTTI